MHKILLFMREFLVKFKEQSAGAGDINSKAFDGQREPGLGGKSYRKMKNPCPDGQGLEDQIMDSR